MSELEVGQEVIIDGVNLRQPVRARIVKLGRVLVTLQPENRTGWPDVYRIEERVRNDAYQHSYFMTIAEFEEREARKALAKRLGSHGLILRGRTSQRLPTGVLERLVAILEDEHGDH
jgi:hypothetical protein